MSRVVLGAEPCNRRHTLRAQHTKNCASRTAIPCQELFWEPNHAIAVTHSERNTPRIVPREPRFHVKSCFGSRTMQSPSHTQSATHQELCLENRDSMSRVVLGAEPCNRRHTLRAQHTKNC